MQLMICSKPGDPFLKLSLRQLMLSGGHKASINHRIGRHYNSLNIFLLIRVLSLASLFLQPAPESIRITKEIPATQHIIRRHNHLISQISDGISRLLIRHRAIIMGYKNNLTLIMIICSLCRRSKCHKHNGTQDKRTEPPKQLTHKSTLRLLSVPL